MDLAFLVKSYESLRNITHSMPESGGMHGGYMCVSKVGACVWWVHVCLCMVRSCVGAVGDDFKGAGVLSAKSAIDFHFFRSK